MTGLTPIQVEQLRNMRRRRTQVTTDIETLRQSERSMSNIRERVGSDVSNFRSSSRHDEADWRGETGTRYNENRIFIDGICWIIRTGSPWRDLPSVYGKFGSIHKRFKRWCDEGKWDIVLEALIEDPDFEWLMVGACHCKVHPHAVGGNQTMGRTKGG